MTVHDPRVIDRDRLAAVARATAVSDENLTAEFLASLTDDAALLRAAAARSDFAPAGQSAHRIGGVCRMLGAARLADACDDVVLACAARSAHAMAGALAAFEAQRLELQLQLQPPR